MENLSSNSNNGDIPPNRPEVIPADQDPEVIRELSRFSVSKTATLNNPPKKWTSPYFVIVIGGE